MIAVMRILEEVLLLKTGRTVQVFVQRCHNKIFWGVTQCNLLRATPQK